MLVSRKLLQKYIDIKKISNAEIAHRLTFAGIEVEDYYDLAHGTKLVIGEVLAVEKIKGSDHLSLTRVNIGECELQIVCGAPNVRKGLKVIVAQVGAVLPEITIKAAKIKGFESSGMLCSLKELGVKDDLVSPADENGIHELPNDAPVGCSDVLAYLNLDDTIFDLHPLANRSDMLAVFNIVRELGALFNIPYRIDENVTKTDFKTALKLDVKTPLVSVFALSEVQNIVVEASPLWLQTELKKHGYRPVNNIVDIGNYVMHLTGRPLHMYDLDTVKDEHFIVESNLNTSFVALDEKEYKLIENDQIIHDGAHVLCLGGISGSFKHGVSQKTKRVAIEVAVFDQAQIRSTVTRLNLPSDASGRFIKGVNPDNTLDVMTFTLALIRSLYPGVRLSSPVLYEKQKEPREIIIFDDVKINKLLGTSFSRNEMIETLSSLNIRVKPNNEVEIPSYRQDIFFLADLAEEIIRVRGFEHIESVLPTMETSIGEYNEVQKARLDIRRLLRSRGLYETLSYTLTSKDSNERFKYLNDDTPLLLDHPMTPLRSALRLNLLPSLIETLSYNVSRQATDFALFEISSIFSMNYRGEHLAFAFYGKEKLNERLVTRSYDFYDAKGLIEMIMRYLGISESRYEIIANNKFKDGLHPSQSALLRLQGKIVGVFGKMHPRTQALYNLPSDTIIGELDFKEILNLKKGSKKVQSPARYPFVTRDLALIVDMNLNVGEIEKVARVLGGKRLVNVTVFDVYTKLVNTPNKKSVAITLKIQDTEKTLVESEIKEVVEKVIAGLKSKLDVEVRSA